jgi:hypothetical protein
MIMKAYNPVCTVGIAAVLLLFPSSCRVLDGTDLDEGISGMEAAGFTAPAEPAARPVRTAPADERRAILTRGNSWVAGLPGFSANAFAALYGEYRLEFPGEAVSGGIGPGDFYVWLSKEPVYLPTDIWEARTGITGYTGWQRAEGDSFLVASEVEGGTNRDTWTVLFQFPQTIGAVLSSGEMNLLIRTWLSRFRYFLSLANISTDISMPAVVNF